MRPLRFAIGLAALLAAAATATAQGNRGSSLDLYYPTGEQGTSLMMIRAQAPEEVRVGQSYQYNLTVQNITDNVTLEGVSIAHQANGSFSIEGAQVGGQDGDSKGKGQGEGIQIGELKPGQSKSVKVDAVAEGEGTAGVCFRVAYTPTICLTTRFVKPQLKVTKEVPEKADICQPLQFRYTVSNPGSADVDNVVVSDNLPEGLKVQGGESTLEREVGTVPAGESKQFTVDLCATRTGDFASRAVAKSGDLSANSGRPTTQIVAADLNATLEGPDGQYIDQPSTYRVNVRNDGDGPAMDTRLEVDVDDRVRLLRTSKTSRNSIAPSQPDSGRLSWNIGTLQPGEETAVSFTVNMTRAPQNANSDEPIMIRHVAEVTSRCATDAAPCAIEAVREKATAEATRQVELVTLPALLLELVDRYDQVVVGENVDYVLTIINQGSGADDNVQLTVELPGSLEFVKASGETEATNDGQTVTFAPIETLAPGEEARYEVIAKANRAGQVSTKASLSSDFLRTPANEAEPTVLIGGDGNVGRSGSSGNSGSDDNDN